MELGPSVKQMNNKVNQMGSLGSSWSSEASSQHLSVPSSANMDLLAPSTVTESAAALV